MTPSMSALKLLPWVLGGLFLLFVGIASGGDRRADSRQLRWPRRRRRHWPLWTNSLRGDSVGKNADDIISDWCTVGHGHRRHSHRKLMSSIRWLLAIVVAVAGMLLAAGATEATASPNYALPKFTFSANSVVARIASEPIVNVALEPHCLEYGDSGCSEYPDPPEYTYIPPPPHHPRRIPPITPPADMSSDRAKSHQPDRRPGAGNPCGRWAGCW